MLTLIELIRTMFHVEGSGQVGTLRTIAKIESMFTRVMKAPMKSKGRECFSRSKKKLHQGQTNPSTRRMKICSQIRIASGMCAKAL